MFQNYIATAVRSLLKNKLFSFINIMGLAIGLAASILIMLFVRYELSYENWLPNAQKVYRVSSQSINGGEIGAQYSYVPGPLRQAMIEEFPEIDNIIRVAGKSMVFKRGDALFNERISRSDPGFFDIFDFEIVAGDRSQVLKDRNSIAMSEKTAKKYFGSEDPIGQTVTANGEETLVVVAVFKDIPENSEMTFDIIRLFDIPSIKGRHYFDEWNSTTLQSYFTLKDGVDLKAVTDRFDVFYNRVFPDDTPETPVTDNTRITALSIKDIHLLDATGDDYLPGGGMKTVISFIIVAILVVGVAVFNFVNSSTAVAQLRAKEVAMRKTLGANRRQLVHQFLSESAIIVFMAFVLAFVMVSLVMPAFVNFWDKPISADFFGDPLLLGGVIALFPLVVLTAGYYPALYLTKFRPAETLMSNKSNNGEKAGLRKALVLGQFSVSIGLAIVATIIQLQFDYSTKRDLGFERENKLIVRGMWRPDVKNGYDALKAEIERLPGVNSMARAYYVIGDGNYSGRQVTADWFDDTKHYVKIAPIDFGYFDLYKVPMITGRDLNEQYANDEYKPLKISVDDKESTVNASVVINRTALKRLEIATAEEALGKTIYFGADGGLSRGAFTIVGVAEDFKERNVREEVAPSVYFVYAEYLQNATISLKPGSLPNVLSDIENVWATLLPNVPIQHQFLDEKLDIMYSPAQRRAQMLYAFSILSIIISALGLYGLASFTAVRRTKEVGLRKVMGASTFKIMVLMVRQFSMPVLLANFIAWPIAYYVVNDWLQGFSYRIDIDPFIFILYGAGALALAWVTVGGHAWNVARKNPVKALRYE